MTDEKTAWRLTFILSISILAAATVIACSTIFSSAVLSQASAHTEKSVKPTLVKYVQSSIDSESRAIANSSGGKIERICFPDGSSALIEVCPMTKEQQAEFGHVKCDIITPEEFRVLGYMEVGLANYTWCDDSVLDLTVVSQMNGLHVEDGVYKDADGYVACYSRTNEMYSEVETPLGAGRVYDLGGDWYTIGVFLSSKQFHSSPNSLLGAAG